MTAETPEETPLWLQLEHLIADIQRDLAPGATVTHNASLYGHDTETDRQIDVLVEQAIGQYQMRIIIDCKDYGRPVDVKGIEAFIGMVRDVRAHQGAMVSAKGFSASAQKLARRANMAIYSPIDTAPHKWQTRLALPAICDFRSAAISFHIACSAPLPFMLKEDFLTSLEAYSATGEALGTPLRTALERWNAGDYAADVGSYEDVPLFGTKEVHVDNGYGMKCPVELTIHYVVDAARYYGELPLKQIRGLRDEQSGAVITNGFTTEGVDPEAIQKHWRKLRDNEPDPNPVAIRFIGLVGHDVADDPRSADGYSAIWPRRRGR